MFGCKTARLNTCFHEFHQGCFEKGLKHATTCGVCRVPVGKPGVTPVGKQVSTTAREVARIGEKELTHRFVLLALRQIDSFLR